MKCCCCKCKSTKDNPVTKGPDPYNAEINEDETEIWECKYCREESANDI